MTTKDAIKICRWFQTRTDSFGKIFIEDIIKAIKQEGFVYVPCEGCKDYPDEHMHTINILEGENKNKRDTG